MARFATEPITDAELQKAIKIVISSHLAKLKTMEGQAADLAHSLILTGDPNFGDTYLANIRKVRPEDIRRAAQRYLTDNNLTITSLNPADAESKTEQATLVGTDVRIEKIELPNGLRLLVREDPKLPFVDIRSFFKGGVIAETDDDNGITKLTARMLIKGTKSRTADQVSESIESVGGAISYFSGNNSFGVSTHSMSDDLDLALDLLADVLQNPSFPADLLARERSVQLAEIKAEQDQILRAGQQLLRETMFARHPYRLNPLGTAESVARLGAAELAAFHRRYVVPNNMVLAVFGNVKADDIRQKVAARFGAMQKTDVEFPKTDDGRIATAIRQEAEKPKEQAVLLIGYNSPAIFSNDRFPVEVLDEIFSGMGSRLFLRLRDELGLCYYCGAFQLVGIEPGFFAFYVGTAPQQAADCEKEILAEVERLQRDGVTDAELERAKNSIIGQRKVRMQDNGDLAMSIGLDEINGLGWDFFRGIDQKYRAVTGADIKRVAAQYLGAPGRATIVVKPLSKEK